MVHSIASTMEKSTRATAPSRAAPYHSEAATMNASISPHIGSSQAKPTRGAISGLTVEDQLEPGIALEQRAP